MMAVPLANKIAIVTGGSKGIGLATAKRLVQDGAKVAINFGSDGASAEAALRELGAENAIAIQADAGTVVGATKIVDEAVKKYGKIDILIPNAGVLPMADLESTTEADFDKAYALNVKGPYFLCQKAVPHMAAGSRIILISTSVLMNSSPPPTYLLYGSTKGAIEQFGRILAKDLGRKHILVNVVSPGPTATELFLRGKPQQAIDMMANWSPFNRLGEPDDIASAIAFLAGPESKWVNGQNVPVNGGAFV